MNEKQTKIINIIFQKKLSKNQKTCRKKTSIPRKTKEVKEGRRARPLKTQRRDTEMSLSQAGYRTSRLMLIL